MNPQPVTQAMVVARALQGRGLELTSYPPSTRRTVSFSISKGEPRDHGNNTMSARLPRGVLDRERRRR